MNRTGHSYARRIVTTAAVYAAAAWAAVEAVLTAIDRFGLPSEWGTLVTAVFVAGLPVTLFLVWHTAGPDRKASFGSIAGSVVALVAGSAWIYLLTLPEPLPAATAVAVVPCEYEGDEQYAYRAEGLAEDVHARLSRVDSVKISSWNSSLFVHDRGYQPPQIAESLNVDRLVRCRIHSDAERIALFTEVIDPAANTVLWKRDYDFDVADLGSVVTELAGTLLDVLGTTAEAAELDRVNDLGTFSSEAYDLFLQAKGVWKWPANIEKDLGRAEALVKRVLEIDPNYAEALVYHGQIYGGRATSQEFEDTRVPLNWLLEARSLWQRALEIDPGVLEARSGLAAACGLLRHYYDDPCSIEEQERLSREECEIRGDTAEGWACLHRLHADEDNYRYLERWLELEPTSMAGNAQAMGHLWYEFDDPVAAMARFDTLRALYPDDLRPPGFLSNMLRNEGRIDEVLAWRWASFGDRLPEGQPWALAAIGVDYLDIGLYDRALEIGLITRETRRFSSIHFLPHLWAAMGETQRAAEEMEWAGQTLSEMLGSPQPLAWVTAQGLTMWTRNHQRARELFNQVLEQLELADICENEGDMCEVDLMLSMAFNERALGNEVRAAQWMEKAESAASSADLEDHSAIFLHIMQGRSLDAIERMREVIFSWSGRGRGDGLDIKLHSLEHMALFDPLRDMPEFQQLIEDYRAALQPMQQRALEAERSGDWEFLRQNTYHWVQSLDD